MAGSSMWTFLSNLLWTVLNIVVSHQCLLKQMPAQIQST